MLGSTGLRSADKTLPPGALVTFLQKGLQYVGIEERLRLEGLGKEGEKGKEGSGKKNAASAASNNYDMSEFSLLSQSAISAIGRRDPPLQLNVPPATAAAAVKARLEAEAKIEAEHKALSLQASQSIQPNNNANGLVLLNATSAPATTPPPLSSTQPPNSSIMTTGTNGGTSMPMSAPPSNLVLPEHISNTAALARHQALALQLQQQQHQQQQLAAAEQMAAAAAASAGTPLTSLATAFAAPHASRTAADILALQQGAQQLATATDASTLADAMALASQQQHSATNATANISAATVPSQSQPKQPKPQTAPASAAAASTSSKQAQQTSRGAGASGGGPSGGPGPKRGTKRQKLHNDEVHRVSETIAGLAAGPGVSEVELHNKVNTAAVAASAANNRGALTPVAVAPHGPSTAMDVEQQVAVHSQHQQPQNPDDQQQQQHVEYRSNAQHANLVGHQEFRPIHQAGQEQQFLNGQVIHPSPGNGKSLVVEQQPPPHRAGGIRGLNGERAETNASNNKPSNNPVVKRMESSESLASNPEDLDTDTPQKHILKLEMHESEVFMCAWNPVYTNLIATGSGDASARIWQVGGTKAAAGVTTVKLLPHGSDPRDRKNKDVTTLEWSSDGTLLATGSYDGVARVWARNGALIHTLRRHTGPIFSLKWNKQGNFLLSGSYDKTTIVWDVSGSTGFVEQQFTEHNAPALDVDWRDNITFASCSTDRTVHICRVGMSRPLKVYVGHSDEVNAVKWDPSGQLLASCSDDCTAKIWDLESDRTEPLYDFKSHEQEIYTVKWSPTGPGSRHPNKKALLATASFDGSVRLWNVVDGSCYRVFNRHKDSVYSVAFSPSGDYLASGSLAGQLYVWDIEEAKHIKSYNGKGDIFEVAWNKEETRVAACFSSNVVAIIDFNRPG